MNRTLIYHGIEYKYREVHPLLDRICCNLCAFSNVYKPNSDKYCGNIPGSGCCNPFQEDEHYGYWTKKK